MNRVTGFRMAAALGVLLLTVAGCTNSDPLVPSAGELKLDIQLQNTSSRFEFNQFKLYQVRLRPTDPQAATALGNPALGTITGQTVIVVDFTGTSPLNNGTVRNIPRGSYVVESVTLQEILVQDLDPPPAGSCPQTVVYYPDPGVPVDVALSGNDIITVEPGGTTLTLTIDGQAFLTAYASSFFPCAGPNDPGQFLPFTFGALGTTFVTVN